MRQDEPPWSSSAMRPRPLLFFFTHFVFAVAAGPGVLRPRVLRQSPATSMAQVMLLDGDIS